MLFSGHYTLKSIGERQNELIKSNAMMLGWATKKLFSDETEFFSSQASYPFEKVKIKPYKSHPKKKK